MKKTYNILRRIAILVAALSVSSAAWSEYYLWYGGQDNPADTDNARKWTYVGTCSSSSGTQYTWSNIPLLGNDGSQFLIISTSNTFSNFWYSGNMVWSMGTGKSKVDPGTIKNTAEIREANREGHDYRMLYFEKYLQGSNARFYRFNITFDSNESASKRLILSDASTYYDITPTLTGSTEGVSVSPNTTVSVVEGGSQVFTLSGMSGKHIASASLSPVAAGDVTTAGTVTVSNVTADATLTINIAGDAVAATAYMGEKPYRDANGDIHAKVFLAQTGGSTVTAIRLYYKNGSEPSDSDDYVDLTAPFSCNNQYNALISGASLEDGTYYLKAKVTNDGGSSYTDVVTIVYVTCEGRIDSFELTPTEGSVIKGQEYTFVTSTDGGGIPSYKWYVNDVEQGGEIESSFTYKIPANYAEDDIDIKVQVTGGNCHDEHTATATMDICATPTISLSGSSTSTPWAPVNITATTTNTETVNWSVTAGGTMYNTSNSGAIFKGASSATAYTVTAEASSGVCGKAQATHTITVSEASEEVCP